MDIINNNRNELRGNLNDRGVKFCRGCKSQNLHSCLDLGELPLANELWKSKLEKIELFPLHLKVCLECTLGQVGEFVSPERLFSDYRYLSSVSKSFTRHAKEFVKSLVAEDIVKTGDWVLEIASNDGYLLQHFKHFEIQVLGIEPAQNVSQIARENGVPTLTEFFTEELARDLLNKFGSPKLIIANNVLAHVPDMEDFLKGIFTLADLNTLISIENPSLLNLLDSNQFDTIYHEHYSYLTVSSVKKITSKLGLYLFAFEELGTHGGSNRYWLSKNLPSDLQNTKIDKQISLELEAGIINKRIWQEVSRKVHSHLTEFNNWLMEASDKGLVVIGYGAAAKASTFINAAQIPDGRIKFILDGSHEKQGRFMPSVGIPIIAPSQIDEICPTDVIIFPWNIADEITKTIEYLTDRSPRIWTLIPEIKRIG